MTGRDCAVHVQFNKEPRIAVELVIHGARQFGIKEYPSWDSWGSLLLKIETRSLRQIGNLWFFGNIIWGFGTRRL